MPTNIPDMLDADMLEAIQTMALDAAHLTEIPSIDPEVMDALDRVPRHEFVPTAERSRAYLNLPLAIGEGQTISQPYIVALMTHLLEIEAGDKVLEVGTGSGYQAAVLAALSVELYTTEIIPALAESATATLERLGFERIHVRTGDGYNGWPQAAPFDAIIVTAGATHVPQPLVEQLADGGVMVIPVGKGVSENQRLLVLTKHDNRAVTTRTVLPVRFVPLTGGH